jgi:oligosaccharide repeat unit polymerase
MDSAVPSIQPKAGQTSDLNLGLKVGAALSGLLILELLTALHIFPTVNPLPVMLATASVAFVFVGRSEKMDLLHPVRVFGALWCLCLGLASLRLLPDIISKWNGSMWACVFTALLAFIAGFGLALGFWKKETSNAPPGSTKLIPSESLLPDRIALIVAALCMAVGVGVLAYEYSLIGEIPVLSQNVDFARTQLFGIAGQNNAQFNTFWVKLVHPLVDFAKYSVFLCCIVLFQRKPKSRRALIAIYSMIFIGALAYISQGGRMFLVTIVVTVLALFHYIRRPIRLVELAVGSAILFIAVGTLGSLRVKQSGAAPLFDKAMTTSSFPAGGFWDGVAFGYVGCTLSLEVFDRLTQDLPRTTQSSDGGYLFYALHSVIPRANIQELDFESYSGEMVTPTFLGEFYADYRYWGVLFGPLVLGLFFGWVYLQAGSRNSMYWIYARALLVQMLLFFPYVNLFSFYLNWIFDLFFMYLLIRWIGRGSHEESLLPNPATA